MANPLPGDRQLEEELSRHLLQGEGLTVEFMATFPEQARELAKEIAALATVAGGVVYLGINDDGTVVGVSEGRQEQDKLSQRATNVCLGNVHPTIRTVIDFVRDSTSKTVMRIEVKKGPEPVYYCGDVPYIRDNTESRPARSNEVTGLHYESFQRAELERTSAEGLAAALKAKSARLAEGLTIAATSAALCDSGGIRTYGHGLDRVQEALDLLGEQARRLARDRAISGLPAVRDTLSDLGGRLADVGEHLHALGPERWGQWLTKLRYAAEAAAGVISAVREAGLASEMEPLEPLRTMRALADQVAHLASEHERAERAGNEGAVRRRMGEVGDEMAMWSQVLALWPVEAADDARQRAQELCRTLWTTEMALSYQNSGSLVDQAASEARGLAEALDARI